MASVFEIPLSGPQSFAISLSGVAYTMTFQYRSATEGGWILDIGDALGNPMVCGIPLVTGHNLLEQYDSLGFPGELWVMSDGVPDAVPTFANLGSSSHVYYIVLP
jgi:hypothetical protein